MKKIFIFIIALMVLYFKKIDSTLGPGDKKSKNSGPKNSSQKDSLDFDRQLLKKKITKEDIINNSQFYCDKPECLMKKFENKVLGYVTPWNSKGYDVSKIFAKKFDMISPVWLSLNRLSRNKYQLKGTHDLDQTWINQVKNNSFDKSLFVPRLIFDNLQTKDLHAIFNEESEKSAIAEILVKNALLYNFDGYTFEIYSQLGSNSKTEIYHLLYDISQILHENDKKMIVVIPPSVKVELNKNGQEKISYLKGAFNKDDFDLLKDIVDHFSLMTYDYSSQVGYVGANAPYFWVKKNVEYLTNETKYRSKILLGLNFYGIKYELDDSNKLLKQPEPIIGDQLIDLLSKYKNWRIEYEENLKEHMFWKNSKTSKMLIYYPTLYSIQVRIQLALDLGTGLSIWELGQGLDYFYDLL